MQRHRLSLGWASQWERLDEVAAAFPDVEFLPVILRCPYETCLDRIERRHRDDPERYPPRERFMKQPQLTQVWKLLDTLDRPDVLVIDADRDHDAVYADTWRQLSLKLEVIDGEVSAGSTPPMD